MVDFSVDNVDLFLVYNQKNLILSEKMVISHIFTQFTQKNWFIQGNLEILRNIFRQLCVSGPRIQIFSEVYLFTLMREKDIKQIF